MSWKNLLRFVGVLALVALLVFIPQLLINIATIWFVKNIVAMAVLLVATLIIGIYVVYLDIRYVIIQF